MEKTCDTVADVREGEPMTSRVPEFSGRDGIDMIL
jgi:hypothetical protein